jgi:N-dimethylarginine dimethylaminohydrolase
LPAQELLRLASRGAPQNKKTAPVRFRGSDSETGLLREVLLASPQNLQIVPCNKVSEHALLNGRSSCGVRASQQHRGLLEALQIAGVKVRTVPPAANLPDLAFTRDTSLMTPWGIIGLRPGASHRKGEVDQIIYTVREAGLPVLGRIGEGRIEGGDVCLLRPGHLVIGLSERRTDIAGAKALARFFKPRGWQVTYTPVEPDLLHLDTHFCMVDHRLALACTEMLQPQFLSLLSDLRIEVLPVKLEEVATLGCNVLALGGKRIISSGSAPRIDDLLRQHGFEVDVVQLDEFTQCGGGVHCLTMPLSRSSPERLA